MLKLVVEINNRRALILGLSEKTIERLHNGEPIGLDVQALIQSTPGSHQLPQDIIVCAGDTETSIYAELRKYMPQLPPYEIATGNNGYCSTYCEHNADGECGCQPCVWIRTHGGYAHQTGCSHAKQDAEGN